MHGWHVPLGRATRSFNPVRLTPHGNQPALSARMFGNPTCASRRLCLPSHRDAGRL